MGKSEYSRTLTGSDSGYGDETIDRLSSSSSQHPLSRKGYEIGPASKLQIGDVFEFLWADCPEFEWEWKCLGYSRFIVLRHSDSFPHYCACVPISVGSKRDFAKPGIDKLQQGYVYASGERDRDRDTTTTTTATTATTTATTADAHTSSHHHHQQQQQQQKHLPQLPYSSVGVNLRGGRHRIKDDSRANYADVIEVDHEAQVMVIGDVARYFDRVRKNVNKAFMRQVLREALGPYCERKKSETAAAGVKGWGNSAVTLTGKLPPPHGTGEDDMDVGGGLVREGNKSGARYTQEVEGLQTSDGGQAHGLLGRDRGEEESLASEDWDGSQQAVEEEEEAPAYTVTRVSSNHRRVKRAASRARGHPEPAMAVRAGMDKVDMGSLRNLRQSVLNDDFEDSRSLRSLAMVGRSDSFTSKRSGR